MALHEQYQLRVTAGAVYDRDHHQVVPVNSEQPIHINSEHIDAKVYMRIKDYRGFPDNSPTTSPYFTSSKHTYDRYSISFTFTPKTSIPGTSLVFGNDFEHPIRDRLPPLFDKAFGIVKWWIDPGLEGDVYGDEPYLYGALLSSINVLRIGSKDQTTLEQKVEDPSSGEVDALVYEEGAEGDGIPVREEKGIPSVSSQRQKFFLTEQNRKDFTFEAGREYKCDFFNPYLDFNEFALKLGYGMPAISIIGHWDGQPLRPHTLRYVLKNKETNTELFVVSIQLLPIEGAAEENPDVKDPEKQFEMVHGGVEKKDTGSAGGDDDLD